MLKTYLFFPMFELQAKFESVSYSSRLKCCLWEVWFQIGNLVFVFFLEALGQCFYLWDFRTFMGASGCFILFHFSCLTLGELLQLFHSSLSSYQENIFLLVFQFFFSQHSLHLLLIFSGCLVFQIS